MMIVLGLALVVFGVIIENWSHRRCGVEHVTGFFVGFAISMIGLGLMLIGLMPVLP